MKNRKNLILYREFKNGDLFYDMTWIMEHYQNKAHSREDVESLLYKCLGSLLELAASHGFTGNL